LSQAHSSVAIRSLKSVAIRSLKTTVREAAPSAFFYRRPHDYVKEMSKLSLIAKLPCAEGQNEEFEAALADLIIASNEEAGLEIYSAHKGADNNYWFFELYTDQAAVDIHGKGDGMKIAMRAIGAFMSGAPEVHRLEPVVAKGMDI
jgi:quinol monooxygenase YgiN